MSECCAYFAGDVTSGELRLSPARVFEELAENPQVWLSARLSPERSSKSAGIPPPRILSALRSEREATSASASGVRHSSSLFRASVSGDLAAESGLSQANRATEWTPDTLWVAPPGAHATDPMDHHE